MNGIVFPISFSAFLLVVYRKVMGFCVLSLYPAALLKVLIRAKSFLMDF
jgi:hypothetical protein